MHEPFQLTICEDSPDKTVVFLEDQARLNPTLLAEGLTNAEMGGTIRPHSGISIKFGEAREWLFD